MANDLKVSFTISEAGNVLTETSEGVTMPADYTFASVNDFVHNNDTQFEDLLALCLGMACHIEKLVPSLDAILMPELEKGAYFAHQDANWVLFDKNGDGIAYGKTISKLLTNLIFIKC